MTSDTILFQSTPSTTLLMSLAPSVELCPPKNDGLQLVSTTESIHNNDSRTNNKLILLFLLGLGGALSLVSGGR